MQKQKGFIQILLLALILLVVFGVGGYYYVTNREKTSVPVNTNIVSEYQTDYQKAANDAPTIVSASDLNTVSADLDATDLDQIDTELKNLAADSSF